MQIPFSPPYIDSEVISEVLETLNSGWITSGPKVKALEEEVTKLTDCDVSVCVNSWTSGAILILKWFGVGPGDEVIVPAYTYSATALSVLHVGATPVMVDIKDDFTIDPDKIRGAITEKTKVIIPVDIAGWPCDYDAIKGIINDPVIKSCFQPNSEKQYQLGRILLLSDAAHSIGAKYKGLKAGTFSDITIFSLHAVKNITTAEGGVICLKLPSNFDVLDEYRTIKLFTLNGQSKDAFAKSQAGGGGWKYDILLQGLKVNMPDLCAAVGLAQIRNYDDVLLHERARVAYKYRDFFQNKAWACPPPLKDEDRTSCYHLYALRVHDICEAQRDQMIELITQAGVSVNVHFIPMPMLTLFKQLGFDITHYPNAYLQYSREISLPIYPQLTDEVIEFICKTVEDAYDAVCCPVV